MPGELCYWIFNMSIIATVTGLLVLLIRRIKFIPRRVSVFLWIIPFARMCVPFGLNSRYSLMTLISRVTTRTVTVYQPTDDI
ncbi:MAG: peptidase M56 BlaR1, partial [Clostridia bacterium]|nr:peptidase M56 BlaR1 [Clostridia bacterium]